MARLRDGGFQRSGLATTKELETALDSTPLLRYAYDAWSIHGSQAMQDSTAKSRLLDFVQGCHAFPILPRERGVFDRFGPLHVVAAFDLPLSLVNPEEIHNPNSPSPVQRLTPLHLACIRRSQLTTRELLSLPRILVNAPDRRGSTPLFWASLASKRTDKYIVELLLSHPKIKVNEANTAGETALRAAAGPGHTASLQLLLAHPKIKVNEADTRGKTPFMVACTSRDVDAVNLFLAHPKLKVNAADKAGTTALMWMMTTGAAVVPIEMVKAILAHPKIDPSLLDRDRIPAAYWAQVSRRKDVLDLLMNHPKAKRR
jgi:ankyrin repeat protein